MEYPPFITSESHPDYLAIPRMEYPQGDILYFETPQALEFLKLLVERIPIHDSENYIFHSHPDGFKKMLSNSLQLSKLFTQLLVVMKNYDSVFKNTCDIEHKNHFVTLLSIFFQYLEHYGDMAKNSFVEIEFRRGLVYHAMQLKIAGGSSSDINVEICHTPTNVLSV